MNSAGPRCASCGYDLSGLVRPADAPGPVCPECGEAYDPGQAFEYRPWPSAAVVAAKLWLPCVLLVVAVCAAERLPRPAGRIAGDLETVGAVLAPLLVLGAPVFAARRLAWRHGHPAERGIIWGGLALVGVGGNLLLLLAGALLRGVL